MQGSRKASNRWRPACLSPHLCHVHFLSQASQSPAAPQRAMLLHVSLPSQVPCCWFALLSSQHFSLTNLCLFLKICSNLHCFVKPFPVYPRGTQLSTFRLPLCCSHIFLVLSFIHLTIICLVYYVSSTVLDYGEMSQSVFLT